MYTTKFDFRDLGLRFLFGGASVAICFIMLQLIPSKYFAGIFAAFPAVMAASVIMAGHFGNSEQASDIALGASTGMLGCIFCVNCQFLNGTPRKLGPFTSCRIIYLVL
jgi:hypothetical protein